MQRALRMNDAQLLSLSEKALHDNCLRGYLCKRTADSARWQLRWFVLYQNLLFYYENDTTTRPSGVLFLEGSYCERLLTPVTGGKNTGSTQYGFTISYRKEGARQYELKAETEAECNNWVHAIDCASFSKMLLQKEELEQKHLHLVQIVESEKTAKWQYTQQCEELTVEIKKLRAELCALKKEWRLTPHRSEDEDSEEIKKIKKVQSFFRGWLCRRRWKQIVAEYISSPHAENMRKRNSLVFRMVEAEEEYVEQLQLLVSCFLRPFKMAASSQKPPCTHDEVNSIFLNSETLMFLHQIFLKGLTARMESWPTLVLGTGDLFDMLLPMLTIYQEYVRNHHYSLQVLAECKQRDKFAAILQRLEEKTVLQGRTLETFLTYPMHQVPRYIITLHELLAHTPHNHVERRSLETARTKLEELSRQMHDEVSETENIRKNLAIERMIIGGCDILLDVNQVFVRQGNVIHVVGSDKAKSQRSRIPNLKGEKEVVRQCYLFTNHMLLCNRTSAGKLHLVESVGKIPLADATLIEDPNDQFQFIVDDGEGSVSSVSSLTSGLGSSGDSTATTTATSGGGSGQQKDYGGLDFKIIVDFKTAPPVTVQLVAPTMQEKAAWTSDISQCIDNVHFNDLFHGTMSDASSVTMPHSIRNDPRLFKDDVDIRFSRTLNSCKLPQIRYASPERLFERLTDLRFLSIDFLNTFLLTYRVFTDGVKVLEALKKVHYNPDLQINAMGAALQDSTGSLDAVGVDGGGPPGGAAASQAGAAAGAPGAGQDRDMGMLVVEYDYSRRISTTSMLSEAGDAQQGHSAPDHVQQVVQQVSRSQQHWRLSYRKFEEEQLKEQTLKRIREVVSPSPEPILPPPPPTPEPATGGLVHTLPAPNAGGAPLQGATLAPPEDTGFFGHLMQLHETSVVAAATAVGMPMSLTGTNGGPSASQQEQPRLEAPKASLSSDTLSADASCPSTPGNLSSTASTATLVGSVGSNESPKPSPSRKSAPVRLPTQDSVQSAHDETPPPTPPAAATTAPPVVQPVVPPTPPPSAATVASAVCTGSPARAAPQQPPTDVRPAARGLPPPMTSSQSAPNVMNYLRVRGAQGKRGSSDTESSSVSVTPRSSFQTESTILSTPRSSFQYPDSPQHSSKAGVVVTSSRASTRRSSTASAAAAFAVATAGSSNPPEPLVAATAAAAAAGGGAVPPGSQPASRAGSRLPSAVGADLKIPGAAGGAAVGPGPAALRAKRESMISTAATMRVLNVLRHWVSKHSQDFENDPKLLQLTTEFLEELVHNPNLLPAEHKAAAQLLHMISKQDQDKTKVDLDILLAPHMTPSKETVESLSALEIAEGMTYLDHKIFIAIRSEEFLGQAWMKPEKATKAPHILLMTRRFNDVSRLVVSEIMRCPEMSKRVTIIDKWSAVADICRCLHNFNGVLQICAAFMNSSVFRLKKTWEKVSKTTKQTIDKLQALVSADGRFRNMRDALHRCDPPCIPYLGMYLTDLSFIEEGTPNFTEEGLLNFSKMRMIAHVIREIRHFQQTPYKIEMIPKVFNYLLDPARLMPDEELYRLSLCLEPRLSRLGTKVTASPFTPSYAPTTTQQSS
ncbi:ras-specific guanine nucleotide-releasing factor 2 isoform X3 [Rhipicephalus sanguineus]|uniref:ras-specific guanine nucleotide-releasing factor 2 isoform X3 n=1 Tax=Rhipicephalus sanguineus TaxID=34632 RepID=UPI0020C4C623|nr:ras-specific guanine nucleotide-releasing factor 2 isoform X3 [Rhipicephalus sanguineus]